MRHSQQIVQAIKDLKKKKEQEMRLQAHKYLKDLSKNDFDAF
jgi:hypothetical protein